MTEENLFQNIDTQLVTENIAFLDGCFDNSFTLQNTLLSTKNLNLEDKDNKSLASRNTEHSFSEPKQCHGYTFSQKHSQIERNNYEEQSSRNRKCIKYWGLPNEIVYQYEKKGITEMFDWQVECLRNSKLLQDYGNLVYSAPTSAGKTLIAEILAIKTVLERQKKVIIILPFVSVVREKMLYLQGILSSVGIRVEGFMGSHAPPGGFQSVHIAICTIEKANSLVNKLMDENSMSNLGAVVVDEMHLLGDPNRGYILELLLTKIKYMSSVQQIQTQIIAMSATFPNLEIIAKWLDAELYVTHFRPIPLEEYCLVANNLFNKEGVHVSSIKSRIGIMTENDILLQICLETIEEGCSILIFCLTKNWCENLAHLVASSFCKIGFMDNEFSKVLRSQLKTDSIVEVLEQLSNCPVGLDEVLKKTVSFGVAYHHAGLTFDERDIVENGFKSGAIKVLIATSTLSSGVNLPARKVIIRTPVFQKQVINILTYKQMVGRAGRMGRDIKGESILFCSENEKKIGLELIKGKLEPVQSCLDNDDKYLRAVLEVIASQVANTTTELAVYEKCTLNYYENLSDDGQHSLLNDTLKQLESLELIRMQNDGSEQRFVATALGKACLSSSMAPHDGLSLFCELQKARQCLVLETELHLIYLVTPYSICNQWGNMDWLHLLNLWESLTSAMKRVGQLVGIEESFIIRCMRSSVSHVQHKVLIHKRFYTALALQDLINEVPLSEVAHKFRCPRGFLQSLQQSAATFAGMVTAFCHQLGWKNLEMLMSQFQDRLHFGIHVELIDLMKLSSLNAIRARSLFNAGFETISDVASADINSIENALYSTVPFQSEKETEGTGNDSLRKKNKLKHIWMTGFDGMTVREAAETLILEARKYLQREIGVSDIKWNNEINQNVNGKFESNNKCGTNVHNDVDKDVKSEKENSQSTGNESQSQNYKAHILKEHSAKTNNSSSTSDQSTETVSKPIQKNIPIITHISGMNHHKEICIEKETSIKSQINSPVMDNSLLLDDISIEKINGFVSKIINSNETSKHLDHRYKSIILNDISNDSLFSELTSEPSKSNTFVPAPIESVSNYNKDNLILRTEKQCISRDLKPATNVYGGFNNTDMSRTKDDSNSSLFEESLPLDLLPSKLFGDKSIKNSTPNCLTPNDSLIALGQSALFDIKVDTIGTLTLAKAFSDSFENIENHEDFKLIFDSEKSNVSENLLFEKNTCVSENSNFHCDNIVNNRDKNNQSCENDRIRDGIEWKTKHIKLEYKDEPTCIPQTLLGNTKLYTIDILNNVKIKCIILDRNNFLDLLYAIPNFQSVSTFLVVKKAKGQLQNIIGYDYFRENIPDNKVPNPCSIFIGIAFYFGQDYCIFYDITPSSNSTTSDFLKWVEINNFTLKLYSLKYNQIYFKKYLGLNLPSMCVDISLSEWLIDNQEKEIPLKHLIKKYCNLDISQVKNNENHAKLPNYDCIVSACTKAWAIWQISERQKNYLQNKYEDVQRVLAMEMQIAKILAVSEEYGMCIDKSLASQMLIDVKESQNILQTKAYRFCGYKFNLNSSKDVAKVLGIYKGRKVSTKKSVLAAHNTPIAQIILYWRKLNAILTKTLYPLNAKVNVWNEDNRIYPAYIMHTCTGRISMHEPNLQSVPRTFSLPAAFLSVSDVCEEPSDGIIEYNCRNIFKAGPGHVLVSADYCQIEMRILTHFCEDETLTEIMKSNLDVFTSIAASWGRVSDEEYSLDSLDVERVVSFIVKYGLDRSPWDAQNTSLVLRAAPLATENDRYGNNSFSYLPGTFLLQVDYELRQRAKQLCYGIIYGMGSQTLSHLLDVSEMEAAVFMDTFHTTYPSIKTYTHRLIDECKRRGYVETLMKRRRYLPDINSKVVAKRCAAERQAVNTTIQGSAADIVKSAMCDIAKMIEESAQCKAHLMLQMHDELIYEVSETSRHVFVDILKSAMENTIELKVPLPVKMKYGYTWGSMQTLG